MIGGETNTLDWSDFKAKLFESLNWASFVFWTGFAKSFFAVRLI